MKKLSIVIPVFNEKDTIEEVLKKVSESPIFDLEREIIVVDDFSTDGTRELLGKSKNQISNIKIIFNKKNSGKGFSVRRGLGEASGDFCIIQDADLEYNPAEYQTLLESLLKGEADVVYGSRFLKHPFSFKSYYLANKFLTFVSNIFTGLSITDMETCYKCFSKEALQKILPELAASRFEIEPEITAKIAKSKLRIQEVSISYNRRDFSYFRKSPTEGKKIRFKDGLEALWAIIKYAIR